MIPQGRNFHKFFDNQAILIKIRVIKRESMLRERCRKLSKNVESFFLLGWQLFLTKHWYSSYFIYKIIVLFLIEL